MPVSFRDIVDDALTLFLSADVHHHNASVYFNNCAGQIEAQNWAGAAVAMRLAAQELGALRWHQSHWPNPDTCYVTDALYWIDDNWPSGAEVDMDAILNAIWNSDKLRWFHFINYIDSMRAGIWNTEIYETHLADWYRHFSI